MAEPGDPHILVTEDDLDLRGALLDLLELEGFPTTYVSTIAEARDVLAQRPDSVLLLDINFRGSHLTAADWLADFLAQNDAPQTLLLSASRANGAALAERFGITFVAKPFDFEDLVRHIKRVTSAGERPRDSENQRR